MNEERKEALKKRLEDVGSTPLLQALWIIVQVLQEVIDELP